MKKGYNYVRNIILFVCFLTFLTVLDIYYYIIPITYIIRSYSTFWKDKPGLLFYMFPVVIAWFQ